MRTGPRLQIDLDLVAHNARTLVDRLGRRGISVTGVTKATLGSPPIARELIAAGVTGLGESRMENVLTLRRAGITAPVTLVRSPMVSQAHDVVRHCDTSLNTEPAVIERLSSAARNLCRNHGIVLMVELGDLREGLLPGDVAGAAELVLGLPHLVLRGIGTNLACQNGIAPDVDKMGRLSDLATSLERRFGIELAVVSGGNSANLDWALGDDPVGRVDDLRLGESLLLGRETLHRRPIDGLRTDAFTLLGEVIESRVKPTRPWGVVHQNAFGTTTTPVDRGDATRVIVALGRQDVDPDGLRAPDGMEILGASSDHLVLSANGEAPTVGAEVAFGVRGYEALLRAMTSPFVVPEFHHGIGMIPARNQVRRAGSRIRTSNR